MKKGKNSSKVKPAQLNLLFNELVSRKETAEQTPPYNPAENKDKTRSIIAKIFVWGYFVGLLLVFVLTLTFNLILLILKLNAQLIDVKEIILTVTGSVGSSLGFVVGYYFKGLEDK